MKFTTALSIFIITTVPCLFCNSSMVLLSLFLTLFIITTYPLTILLDSSCLNLGQLINLIRYGNLKLKEIEEFIIIFSDREEIKVKDFISYCLYKSSFYVIIVNISLLIIQNSKLFSI